jgi:hypothetical protein
MRNPQELQGLGASRVPQQEELQRGGSRSTKAKRIFKVVVEVGV